MIKSVLVSAFSVLLLIQLTAQQNQSVEVAGPDQKLKVTLELVEGELFYNAKYDNVSLLENSPLGLITSIGDFSKSLKYVKHSLSEIDDHYELNKAKVSKVHYEANQIVSSYINENQDTLHVIANVSKNDLAFSYKITTKERVTKCKVFRENTGFNLPDYSTTYLTHQSPAMVGWEKTKPSYEEEYTKDEPVGTSSQYGVGYTFPGLFKVGNDGYVLVSETGVDSRYVGSRLGEGTKEGLYMLEFPQEGENNGIGDTFAAVNIPFQSPWRTLTFGKTLDPIVESTVAFDVVKPLYEPSMDYKMGRATWSWIVWQDGSINYEDQVKFIDLAQALNFEYVLIDNWWDKNIGRKRMEELVKYADSKGVDVLLWYNSNGFWNDAPQTPQDCMNTSPARKKEMQWLQSIGVKGLKVDFFGGDKQTTMQLYEDIFTDANEYGLTITVHGCTLPRGWERMYPNFVTAEAVLASENLIFRQSADDIHPYYATVLPFVRNSVATMDFAPVFFNKRMSKDQVGGNYRRSSDAFELATSVLYFSAVQHYGITPNNLDEQPEYVLDFIREVPSVWDETRLVAGEIGKYCVLARRSGSVWYVAAVNGTKEKLKLDLDLSFVSGENVKIYFDKKERAVGYSCEKFRNERFFSISLLSEGGTVLQIQ